MDCLRTHVLKIDRTSLPVSVKAEDFDARGNRFWQGETAGSSISKPVSCIGKFHNIRLPSRTE